MTGILRTPRRAALAAISGLVAAASAVSFAESYRGLYIWATEHGLHGVWAVAWPIQVDTFVATGELALFVALADRWRSRSRAAAWLVTVIGLAVSVAGNIGHVAGHSLASRATAAVPPLAAASALAVGLGVLKRVVERHHEATSEATAKATREATPKTTTKATAKTRPKATTRASGTGLAKAAREAREAAEQGRPVPSARALAQRHHIGRARAGEVRATVLAEANGHAPAGNLTG